MINGVDSQLLREDLFPGNAECHSQLKQAIRDREIICFTGAGVSAPLYPVWAKVLVDLLGQVERDGLVTNQEELALVREQICTDPLVAASFLEEAISRKPFRDRLASVFESRSTATECQSHLVRLEPKAIVTLNYDDGFEVAYSKEYSLPPHTIRSQDQSELTRWLQGRTFGQGKMPILHWHGTPADPENMVFTGDDYDRFYSDEARLRFVEQLWRDSRLLVIGFGFTDPFLTRIAEHTLRSLSSDNRHFAFIGVATDKPMQALVRRQFCKKYRLTPLFYQIRLAEDGTEDHSDLNKLLGSICSDTSQLMSSVAAPEDGPSQQANLELHQVSPAAPSYVASENVALRDFEKDLFVSPGGRTLYVEARLLKSTSFKSNSDELTHEPVSISEIVRSERSFVIATRPEYGSTTLSKRLVSDMLSNGMSAVYRDAELLPNYKKKLMQEFDVSSSPNAATRTLVLDAFDIRQHERLLKELIGLGYFTRYIVILTSRSPSPSNVLSDGAFGVDFDLLTLAHLERSDIRQLATDMFESSDADLISTVVEKVYSDLLALCIPLTPANVIMYISILHKEGDFAPLNRVQIVDRYLQELLRKPSDAYQESFNARNKSDVISAFVYSLFDVGKTSCTENDWYTFCQKYMETALIAFDERALLSELLRARVFMSVGGNLTFKYRFFYSYFLGRHVANRASILTKFMKDDSYLSAEGLVEVITGVSADSTALVEDLVDKLEAALSELQARYQLEGNDPFLKIEWPTDLDEEKSLWQPIGEMLAAGPLAVSEVDKLKKSIQAERRTEDQEVTLFEFDKLESKIVAYSWALVAAVNNSDSLDGELKKRALHALFDSYDLTYMIGLMYAPIIARHRFFFWNGISFNNDIEYDEVVASNETKQTIAVALAMGNAVARKAAEEIGSKKLGEVYRAFCASREWVGLKRLMLFTLLLRSKPRNWYDLSEELILHTDRKSHYMRFVLFAALGQFHEEVNTNQERDALKRLVATIRTKRDLRKDAPGAKAVSKVLGHLESNQFFRKS